MARLIDEDDLKATFVVSGEFAKDLWHAGAIRLAISNAPTVDAVEVVRCKDCRHWIERTADGIDTFHTCWFNDSITGKQHFCRYGERRNDG